ncbi:lipin [Novymonas esmeraldas]|uniref:Lipin n=1 Tax=Novymonas esmeraldas TaxID=1808958 RepID=A0AAW0F4E0_9TRYP
MISTLGEFFDLNNFDQSSRANDVIVIRHKDGSLHSTPFNVRFGRARMWNYVGRVVQVEVNGELTTAVMKIGKGGDAYWLQPTYSTAGTGSRGETATSAADRAAGGRGGAEVDLDGVGSLGSAVKEGEALDMGPAELGRLSIQPESPPLMPQQPPAPPSPPSDAAGPPHPALASVHADVVPPPVPGPPDSAADAPHAAPGDRAGLVDHHAGSQDSIAALPLLHAADDGHLTVEKRAIHSAGDAQEARLALRAMAAAERSRKRLRRMGLGEDPYLLQSAQEEGELGSSTSTSSSSSSSRRSKRGEGDDTGAMDTVSTRGDDSAARGTAPDAADGSASAPASPASPAGADAAAAPPSPPQAAPPSPPPAPTTTATTTTATTNAATAAAATAAAAAAAVVPTSPATSVSGSTDSYKVEDEDAFFLDPLEAGDDYAVGYDGAAATANAAGALRWGASVDSTVTSGVSLPDVDTTASCGTTAAGGGGGEAARAGSPPSLQSPHAGSSRPASPGKLPPPPPPRRQAPSRASADESAGSVSLNQLSISDDLVDAEGRPVAPATVAGAAGGAYFTRTLIPVEADLWKLRLREGTNTVRYLARKDKGDVVSIACRIFLWNWTDRLVVSDVDGTITKSDLLGHFYAMLGKGGDWTHPGICGLYSKIERNGYRMMYLTARSVSQINQTKTYLFTLQQDGVALPMGPVLTAPQRFFTALTREVSKQSHVFKIACLTSVRAAFPPTTKPFFAGFGNRYNDVISYDAAGIPTHKIFIIDPSSVLHVCLVRQTYRDLGHLVDITFPPVRRHPIVLRPPRHLRHTRSGAEAAATTTSTSTGGGGAAAAAAAAGRDRHSYGRGLLHRSASASSSSSSAVSTVSAPASTSTASDSLEERGLISGGSSDWGQHGSSASATPQPRHLHQHLLPAVVGGSGGGLAARHTSAAFSLVDSERVDVHERAAPGGVSAAPAAVHVAASQPSGAAGGVQVATTAAAAAPRAGVPGPRQHRHQRPTFAELDEDDSGDERGMRAAGTAAAEEEMPADPDFTSYVYWRMDPRDLVSATAPDKKSVAAVPAPKAAAAAAVVVASSVASSPTTANRRLSDPSLPLSQSSLSTTAAASPRKDGVASVEAVAVATPQPPPAPSTSSAAPALPAATTVPAKSSGAGGRSFFAAFSFSRNRAAEVPPPASTALRGPAGHEDAQRRALLHPDARDYYHAVQQHTQQPPSMAAASPLPPIADSSSTTLTGKSAPPRKE